MIYLGGKRLPKKGRKNYVYRQELSFLALNALNMMTLSSSLFTCYFRSIYFIQYINPEERSTRTDIIPNIFSLHSEQTGENKGKHPSHYFKTSYLVDRKPDHEFMNGTILTFKRALVMLLLI